ncbi:MAG: arginine deiminase family protein [Sphingobium sp.]|uniref:dimethylarginine dimethylaminohydrolase family protein n=1 Tax=Sphingobium sp. TaxID=1912891 RepID=UPI0029A414A6|nr:arginine deiminase family protein [Sphingobium sp.]MDX3909031.1 arginine deiminase family protein [Sphingobium sp.]
MKVDFDTAWGGTRPSFFSGQLHSHVMSETDRLTDVILCPPHYLAPVACCAVTRHSIKQGFATCTTEALAQHEALAALLEEEGVRCHMLRPASDLPDMCFTRDVGVATPFGLFALSPALGHRRREVDALLAACRTWDMPVTRIEQGTIEGGDICIARDGLLLIGMSGERSSAAGAEEFAAPFRAAGWEVILCPFHADHLHLDTIFCMLAQDEAIGCIELLDPAFLDAVRAHGIRILPAPAQSAFKLGCNILALGDRRIIASAQDDIVAEILRVAGYRVRTADISQFAACGGGVHCLTQPVRRVAA